MMRNTAHRRAHVVTLWMRQSSRHARLRTQCTHTSLWCPCRRSSSLHMRRARSASPEGRQRSPADARGYGSDSEALGGLARSQSLLHPAQDALYDAYGDIYSPLRSGIQPGSFTFASLNELGAFSDLSGHSPETLFDLYSCEDDRCLSHLVGGSCTAMSFTKQCRHAQT